MPNTVKIIRNGPLIVRGELELYDAESRLLDTADEIGLCRCGASARKPYCDGTHKRTGFEDPAIVEDDKPEVLEEDGPLIIQMRSNAMYIFKGPMTLVGEQGTRTTRNKAALCRCGASARKPFCDVSHKACGFSDT